MLHNSVLRWSDKIGRSKSLVVQAEIACTSRRSRFRNSSVEAASKTSRSYIKLTRNHEHQVIQWIKPRNHWTWQKKCSTRRKVSTTLMFSFRRHSLVTLSRLCRNIILPNSNLILLLRLQRTTFEQKTWGLQKNKGYQWIRKCDDLWLSTLEVQAQ